MKKTIFLSLVAATLALAGCSGGGSGGSDTRTLKVEFVKAGFGLKPYEDLANAFMKEHPDVKVKLVPNPEMASTTATKLANGTNLSDVMIYNRSVNNIRLWSEKGYIYDMTDLLDDVIDNNQTLREKLDENAYKVGTYKDKFYCIPEYYNINGFVYNASLFEKYGWDVPNTTAQFESLCKKIEQVELGGKKVKPIVYCGGDADGYLYYPTDGWMTSYEGVANMDKFYAFDSAEVYNPTNQQGKVWGLTNVQKYFYDSGYAMDNSMEMNAYEGQSKLLTYEAAMMPNGSWFENEMSSYMTSSSPTLKMFKIPEVTDKTGAVIHADGYTTNEAGQSVINTEFVANMFIPSKASNLSDAIEFIKFTCREDICEMYTKDTNAVRPLNYDYSPDNEAYSDMSEFGKSVLEIANNNCMYVPDSKAPVAICGKASLNPQGGYWYKKLYTDSSTITPASCVQSDYDYAKENWDAWVAYANENI